MCKVPSYVACQCGTNGKRVENNGGSGVVGARGKPRAEAGIMSRDVRSGAETVWWKGVPLTDVLYSSLNVIIDAITCQKHPTKLPS